MTKWNKREMGHLVANIKLQAGAEQALDQAVAYLATNPTPRPEWAHGQRAVARNDAAKKMELEVMKGVTTPSRTAYFDILTIAVRLGQRIHDAGGGDKGWSLVMSQIKQDRAAGIDGTATEV